MISELEQQGIELRLATPADASDLVDFHNAYYGTNRKPEHWLWQYHTYEPDKAVFVFAQHNGRVVATAGRMPIYMEIGTEDVLTGKGENALCLPAYRGTGIMRSIFKYRDENCTARGIQFAWGLSPTVEGAKKMDRLYHQYTRQSVGRVQVLLRSGNIWLDMVARFQSSAPLWRRVGSVGKLILKSSLRTNGRTIPQIEKKRGYEVRKGRIPDGDLRGLSQRVKSKNENAICIRYDEKYLSWRIREHPFLKYDEYQVCQGAKLRAYAFVVLF
ncbi:GNAT family N-acetyltransferase, partial [Chloroflexota bacterium]